MAPYPCIVVLGLAAMLSGCASISAVSCPSDRLSFPQQPVRVTVEGRFYDVNGRGYADFAILHDESGRLNVLAYDDNGDGVFDRRYRLSDYQPEDVPHLVVLMDSLSYRMASERYAAGDWNWFFPPQKVVPPFPSMSILTFSQILQAPPPAGLFERYYDRATQEYRDQNLAQVMGYHAPWHLRMDFVAPYWTVGMMYLNPRPWLGYELLAIKQAFDTSPNRVCVVYAGATSGMLSRYGARGEEESLDQLEQFCMQVLYERRGAVKITIVSDHSHNLTPSKYIQFEDTLRRAGFRVRSGKPRSLDDVVIEVGGLVTCFGIHTQRPADVAETLLRTRGEIELVMYQEADRVVVCGFRGAATIERRGTKFRYVTLDRTSPGDDSDVLSYRDVLAKLSSAGQVDAEGFVEDRDWFLATADHDYPDGPRRLWDAFHGQMRNSPDVQVLLRDGYCIGEKAYADLVTMASTHGGLNRLNSSAVILTMARPLPQPLRSREVMGAIEPRYVPELPGRMDRK